MATTNEGTQRDELFTEPVNVDEVWESGYHAGYAAAKPRTIMDRHEDNGPGELPPLSVVLSGGKPAIMQHDGTFMDYDGCSYDTWEMDYPLTVIHEPEAEATR